jgi:hypothetical protein
MRSLRWVTVCCAIGTGCAPHALPSAGTEAMIATPRTDAAPEAAKPVTSGALPSASGEPVPPFSPAPVSVSADIRCSVAERLYVTIPGIPNSTLALVTSLEIRKSADRTTLRVGPTEHQFFDVDGVQSDTKPKVVNAISGKRFEVKDGAVKRVDVAQLVPAALTADVLGVIGPFNDVGATLRPGNASTGPMDPRLATLFAAQFLGLISGRGKLGDGRANLLSVREYAGEWLARIEFLTPVRWADRDGVAREILGEALVRMDGFVVSMAARSSGSATNRPEDQGESTVHLRCRDTAKEEE